jgi:transposase IS66-like protein
MVDGLPRVSLRFTRATCLLNNIEPFAYLTSALTAIVKGHKQSQIEGLLPWNLIR